LGPGATAWIILKAVPGNPGKFYRLFRAPLNDLGTQCTSLGHGKDLYTLKGQRFLPSFSSQATAA